MKEKVVCLTYVNGALIRQTGQNRKIYHRKDGTRYVVVMGAKRNVHTDKDGGLFYEIHAHTLLKSLNIR